jgi:hypothetical protein
MHICYTLTSHTKPNILSLDGCNIAYSFLMPIKGQYGEYVPALRADRAHRDQSTDNNHRSRAAHSAGSGALGVGEIGMIVVGVCDLSVRGERSEEDQPWLGGDQEAMFEP